MHQSMRFFIIAVFAAILALISCKQESAIQRASDGTEFIIQNSTGSPKVQRGEFVYYHAQRRLESGEVESRSRDMGDAQIFQVPAENDPNSQTALLEESLAGIAQAHLEMGNLIDAVQAVDQVLETIKVDHPVIVWTDPEVVFKGVCQQLKTTPEEGGIDSVVVKSGQSHV